MQLFCLYCATTAPRENILQCHSSRICSALLHCFLYGCMSGTSFSMDLLGCMFLWLLTCEATAQLCPKIPAVDLDTAIMRTSDKSLGSLLNVPYFTHFSFQSILKMWIAGWPPYPLACFVVYNEAYCLISSMTMGAFIGFLCIWVAWPYPWLSLALLLSAVNQHWCLIF